MDTDIRLQINLTLPGTRRQMRALAGLVTDFLMEAEVTAKVGAEPRECARC